MIQLKRAYEPPAESDGMRVLVDRLWPRGLRKERAHIDAWLKDVAPSDELRRWFGHDPGRFREFGRRYGQELRGSRARPLVMDLARRARAHTITLVYAARDADHNNAVVLAQELKRRAARQRPRSARSRQRVRASAGGRPRAVRHRAPPPCRCRIGRRGTRTVGLRPS